MIETTSAAPDHAGASPVMYWITGASVTELTRRLVAAGDGARLEARIRDDHIFYRVVPLPLAAQSLSAATGTLNAPADDPPDIDDSFVCPPICPP